MPSPDRTAEFIRLLQAYDRGLHGYILALVGDWEAANDLLQETSVRLWEQFDEFRPDGDFSAWARAIARYQVLNYFNHKKRERLVFSEAFVATVADRAGELSALQSARGEALAECLGKLDDGQRELIRRCYAEEATIKSVADDMGRSLESTYKSVQRIRKSLHDCIRMRLAEEEA